MAVSNEVLALALLLVRPRIAHVLRGKASWTPEQPKCGASGRSPS